MQDGFDLYLHSFLVTDDGKWTVVQQGMNGDKRRGMLTLLFAISAKQERQSRTMPIISTFGHRTTVTCRLNGNEDRWAREW